jgi:BCD family chlorophyll transporter-like MFS transporter
LPLNSTLNRIMINELRLPATLVAVLISLRYITSPTRIWFGRLSDTRPIGGRRRTWYIAIGMVLLALGLIASTYAALAIPNLGAVGIALSVLAFGLLGLGVNMTTPLYFAVVADQSSAEQRPRVVALMFVLLGVVAVIASFALAAAVDPYTEQKMIRAFFFFAAIGLVLTIGGLFKLEPRSTSKHSSSSAVPETERPRAVRELLLANPEALRFFFYLLLAFVAIEAQELILEPYAAQFLRMTPAETTRLTGVFRIAYVISLAVGAWLVNHIGHKRTASAGIAIACVSLLLVIVSVPLQTPAALLAGVFILGLGSGLLTTSNLALMMNMTDPRHAGVYLGAWGFAQAVGFGSGNILGGALRDLGILLFGSQLGGYYLAYVFEIALLVGAVPMLWTLDVGAFRRAIAGAPASREAGVRNIGDL